jgi:HEAT repeat protein
LTESRLHEHRSQDFAAVRSALDAAGLPSADFGRFTSNRHPDVIRPSVFDFRESVPILLATLPSVSHPDVVESIVRSLSTAHARPRAALPLIALFKDTATDGSLKWAIGNALSVVTQPAHGQALLALALDRRRGKGRQMIVERLGRLSGDPLILDGVHRLITDPDVALHAQAALRRLLGNHEAGRFIQPLLSHQSERVRQAAASNLKLSERADKRKARKRNPASPA